MGKIFIEKMPAKLYGGASSKPLVGYLQYAPAAPPPIGPPTNAAHPGMSTSGVAVIASLPKSYSGQGIVSLHSIHPLRWPPGYFKESSDWLRISPFGSAGVPITKPVLRDFVIIALGQTKPGRKWGDATLEIDLSHDHDNGRDECRTVHSTSSLGSRVLF